ncbi:methyltransferase domain-containing protein [Prosthecobacter sp.]|uniref:class I SAM-dependent methyltransferase n=1 Tax=Prosthecobacter sp. TaxID=1965333 RepID=UPI00248968C2|nr:methyltransferase domain-containing protein [Prosthecobacter sp.]MDI1312219.1 methyltransferase domain-containing protein [Prosthecobacter sp.]
MPQPPRRPFRPRPSPPREPGSREQEERPQGNRPQGDSAPSNRPQGNREYGNRPQGKNASGNREHGNQEYGSRPQGNREPVKREPGNRAQRKLNRTQGGHEHRTSWEKSADWYDGIIGERGSELYQAVVIPGALGLLAPKPGERVLDLGCGQGVFSRALAQAGCQVTGIDAAPTLIQKARTYPVKPPVRYLARDAAEIEDLGEFDAASAILCVQNMEHLDVVSAAAAKVLKSGGRMLWVVNHPAFRIPRQTSWGNEEATKIQYRRIDAYSSTLSIPIIMHPGQADSETTTSFHRSLQTLTATGFSAGLRLAGIEEWYSHKESQPGPRAAAENRSRKEFPLFLALLWEKR